MNAESMIRMASAEVKDQPPELKRQTMFFFLDNMAVAAGRMIAVVGSDKNKINGLLCRFEARMWNAATDARKARAKG